MPLVTLLAGVLLGGELAIGSLIRDHVGADTAQPIALAHDVIVMLARVP